MSSTPPLKYSSNPELGCVHPLVRLLAYIEKDPQRRKLERKGDQVWLRTEHGVSCVQAPSFGGDIIAPTHNGTEPLF